VAYTPVYDVVTTLPATNTSLWILVALSWGILLAGLFATTGEPLSRRGEK